MNLTEVVEDLMKIVDFIDEEKQKRLNLLKRILLQDNSDNLLIALGMAVAFSRDMIHINDIGESFLKNSLINLNQIKQDYEGEED